MHIGTDICKMTEFESNVDADIALGIYLESMAESMSFLTIDCFLIGRSACII